MESKEPDVIILFVHVDIHTTISEQYFTRR